MADPTSLTKRHCQETDEEDKATGHKAQSPVTPLTKGDTTAWVVTEIAHGINLVPGTRVLHPRHQETLVNGPGSLCREERDWSQHAARPTQALVQEGAPPAQT